jgi:hypothetical protein
MMQGETPTSPLPCTRTTPAAVPPITKARMTAKAMPSFAVICSRPRSTSPPCTTPLCLSL